MPAISTRESCPVCFTQVSRKEMKRHLTTHGEPRYKCRWTGCSFGAHQKHALTIHQMQHTGETIPCPDCVFTTRDPGSLTRHRKRRHGYVPAPRAPRYKPSSASSSTASSSSRSSPVEDALQDFDWSIVPSFDFSFGQSSSAPTLQYYPAAAPPPPPPPPATAPLVPPVDFTNPYTQVPQYPSFGLDATDCLPFDNTVFAPSWNTDYNYTYSSVSKDEDMCRLLHEWVTYPHWTQVPAPAIYPPENYAYAYPSGP